MQVLASYTTFQWPSLNLKNMHAICNILVGDNVVESFLLIQWFYVGGVLISTKNIYIFVEIN